MNDIKRYINRNFCFDNGVSTDQSFKKFNLANKRYYQDVEDYDWIEVTDGFRGLEAILHHLREAESVRLINQYGNGEFLDAGCGTGLILRHLPGGSVGLDINPRNIKRARRYAPKTRVVLGDIEKMPFKNCSFNTVVCTEVLEHLPRPQKALGEIFRVLVPGKGTLLGSVPAKTPIWRLRFLSSTHPGEPFHRLYQKREIKRLLGSFGRLLKLKRSCLGMNFFFVVKHE